MARLSVYFLQEVGNYASLVRNINPSDITIEKNGSPVSVTWTNNGDGTYYTNIAQSGLYTVKLNGSEQDEFKNIYIAAEDTLTSGSVDQTTITINGSGQLTLTSQSQYLATSHIVDNLTTNNANKVLSAAQGYYIDQNFVKDSDIVNNLTSGGTTVPLSAEMGKTLNSSSLKYTDILQNINTGGTNKVVSATAIKNAVELNFAVETLLDDSKTISQNFELLQAAYNSVVGLNNVAETVIPIYTGPVLITSASNTLSQDNLEASYMKWTTTSTSFQHKFRSDFMKAHNMKTMVMFVQTAPVGVGSAVGQLKLQCEDTEAGITVARTTDDIIDSGDAHRLLTVDLTGFTDGNVISCDLFMKRISGSNAFGTHNQYMRVWTSTVQENVLRTKYGINNQSGSTIIPQTGSVN